MSKPAKEQTLAERLRERAAAFNDAGLRYGVADLLNEAADELEGLNLHEEFAIEGESGIPGVGRVKRMRTVYHTAPPTHKRLAGHTEWEEI